ncbi:MAG: EscU/YscU/HrcU family type III secretion system export apparatus switch protein, partial [Smithellaceae bacterium]
IAEKIREIAGENDIPIVENKPLAQVLYKTVDIDRSIPEDLYRAVAEVLAFVYEQKKIKVFG